MKRSLFWLAMIVAASFFITPAKAHKPSDSFLTLDIDKRQITGQWDIALRDLDHAVGLDQNADRKITWGEVQSMHEDIAAYALARLDIKTDGRACTISATDHLISDYSDGRYASLSLVGDCPTTIETLDVGYNLFFDLDSLHRGLINIRIDSAMQTRVLSPADNDWKVSVQEPDFLSQAANYVREGLWHIWMGADHLLFLITLLTGTFIRRTDKAWRFEPNLRQSLFAVLGVVSAFTIAHSVTLSLAVLNIVRLPPAFVETMIAISIIVAALNNLFPIIIRRIWLVALIFGLVHGFGFAGALNELGLGTTMLILSLLSFNLGVELGQIAVVLASLSLLMAARRLKFQLGPALTGGQVAVMLVGAFWLADRSKLFFMG